MADSCLRTCGHQKELLVRAQRKNKLRNLEWNLTKIPLDRTRKNRKQVQNTPTSQTPGMAPQNNTNN